MRSGRKKAILTAGLSLISLTAVSVGVMIMYFVTRYLPLMLMSAAMLLPAAIELVILLFGFEATALPTDEKPLPDGASKLRRVIDRALKLFSVLTRTLRKLYIKSRLVVTVVLTLISAVGAHLWFWVYFPRMTSVYSFTYLTPVILVLLFVAFLVVEKLCAHSRSDEETRLSAILKNIQSALATGRLMLALMAVVTVIKLLGFYDLQNVAIIAIAVVFCYETAFIVLSFAARLIRREILTEPDISVPVPFSGEPKELGVIGYLEKNTGITMRSLWSIKLIKRLVPGVIIAATLVFWLGTGVIQIEATQTGALYRMGKLEKSLDPGLHFTLPWPFDRVEVYETGKINRMTIGYISSESNDNIWTSTHGANEYKLLMGSGNELVSINLRIEYRIADLDSYLRSSASPEKLLEASAYELVTEKTAKSDLNALLSVDRNAFTQSFAEELKESIGQLSTGLEINSVLLESIHPPLEISESYQNVVSAGIKAETIKIDATAEAEATRIQAEIEKNAMITAAEIARIEAIAAASSDVSVFMANVEAFNMHPDRFRYYRYIETLRKSYSQTKLIIVGEGIDSSNIYFGKYPTVEKTDTTTPQK